MYEVHGSWQEVAFHRDRPTDLPSLCISKHAVKIVVSHSLNGFGSNFKSGYSLDKLVAWAFDAYPIGTSIQRLPKLVWAFDAYLIGTSVLQLLNWHERSTLTQLARAFNAYPNWYEHLGLTWLARAFDAYQIGTSIRCLPNWHERSTLTQLIGTSLRWWW